MAQAPAPAEYPKTDGRSWQTIATELSRETDSDKITNLSDELTRALDKEQKRRDRYAA